MTPKVARKTARYRPQTRQLKIPHAQSSNVPDDIMPSYTGKNDTGSLRAKPVKLSMRRVTTLLHTHVTPSIAKTDATSQRPPLTSPFVTLFRRPLAAIRSTRAGTIRYCLVSQSHLDIGCGIHRQRLYQYAAHRRGIVPQSHSPGQATRAQQTRRPAPHAPQTAQPPQNPPRPSHRSRSPPTARRAQNTPPPPIPRARHH